MDKQEGKCTEINKEERKEMVKTDRERCGISYKPDVFYMWIEDRSKVESGDVSETVGAVLPDYTMSHRKNNSLHIYRKERKIT